MTVLSEPPKAPKGVLLVPTGNGGEAEQKMIGPSAVCKVWLPAAQGRRPVRFTSSPLR